SQSIAVGELAWSQFRPLTIDEPHRVGPGIDVTELPSRQCQVSHQDGIHKWAEPSLHFGGLIKRHVFEALNEEPPVDGLACLRKVLRERPAGISELLEGGLDRSYVGLGLFHGLLCAGEV